MIGNTWLIIHQVFATRKINLETKPSLGLPRPRSSQPREGKEQRKESKKKGRKARRKEGKPRRKEEENKEKACLVEFSWLKLEVVISLKVSS